MVESELKAWRDPERGKSAYYVIIFGGVLDLRIRRAFLACSSVAQEVLGTVLVQCGQE